MAEKALYIDIHFTYIYIYTHIHKTYMYIHSIYIYIPTLQTLPLSTGRGFCETRDLMANALAADVAFSGPA